jgi:hypothetical protein
LSLLQHFICLKGVLGKSLADFIERRLVRNDVLDTNCKAVLVKPVVDQELGVGEEISASIRSLLLPDDVDHTS